MLRDSRFGRSLAAALGVASASLAVSTAASEELAREPVPVAIPAPPPVVGAHGPVMSVTANQAFERQVVRGVPFSAQTETVVTQTLADGNRLVRREQGLLARDSAGRTRREQRLAAIAGLVGGDDIPRLVSILDPVAGYSFVLDAATHTARRVRLPDAAREGGSDGKSKKRRRVLITLVPLPMPIFVPARQKDEPLAHEETGAPSTLTENVGTEGTEAQRESLGTRTIGDVSAEGTRDTDVIPAGAIGNERPITVTSERWYSPELQAVVWTVHDDPRFGRTDYRLHGIERDEPDATLFTIPSDYKVVDSPGRDLVFQQGLKRRSPDQ